MTDFFSSMDSLLRTFWYISIPVTIIFIIQTILTFTGGADMDSDTFDHSDADGFELFSFRNLINFLLGFGWSGISFFPIISNPYLLILVATLTGVAFVSLFFIIIRQIMKFAEDNTFNIQQTLNQSAEVYLTIPAQRTGVGKVLISVNGSVHEIQAITDAPQPITSGSRVKITEVESTSVLVVKPI